MPITPPIKYKTYFSSPPCSPGFKPKSGIAMCRNFRIIPEYVSKRKIRIAATILNINTTVVLIILFPKILLLLLLKDQTRLRGQISLKNYLLPKLISIHH